MIKYLAYAIAVIIALFILWIFKKPLKSILFFMMNSILGGLFLYFFNMLIGEKINLVIGLNIVTSAICGLFGIPGFILLVIIKWLFG